MSTDTNAGGLRVNVPFEFVHAVFHPFVTKQFFVWL